MNKNRIFGIGDIHGHFDQWIRLYEKLKNEANLNPQEDTLVFIGDYIDGGPQTKEVLDWLIVHKSAYPHWQMLYGNHEDLLLDALLYNGRIYGSYDLWWTQGGRATYKSFLPPEITGYEKAISQVKDFITPVYLDWLRQLPMYFETDEYFFVHGGLWPGVSIEAHKLALSKNDERIRQKMLWIRDEFYTDDYNFGKTVVFGHTCFKEPFVREGRIGIDGMFHNDGQLVAVELPIEKFYIERS